MGETSTESLKASGVGNTGWICPKCGKVNAPWVASCDCVSSIKITYPPYVAPYQPYNPPWYPYTPWISPIVYCGAGAQAKTWTT